MSVKTIDEAIRNQKTEALLKLIKKNPDLPILPLVDADVVGDGDGWWMGSFGRAYVGEYAYDDERYYTDRDDFKENYYDRNDEDLCEQFNYDPRINSYTLERGDFTEEQLKINEAAEALLEKHLDKIAEDHFKKAIIVYIDVLE